MASTMYYGPHPTKVDYDNAFAEAYTWALESDDHRPLDAARIYHVKEYALISAIRRTRKRMKDRSKLPNAWGGNNKILNTAQEDAIHQFCYDQWEMGLGATHAMVKAAIAHLKQVSSSIYSPSFIC